MNWIDKLRNRWNAKNSLQVILILVVFILTGTTVMYIKNPLILFIFNETTLPLWANIVYFILILPIYNLLLLVYGFFLGQFNFFWNFEKKFFNRVWLKIKKKNNSKTGKDYNS